MLTPHGVPWQPFSRSGRFSLNLCSTGSPGEYCFLACVVAAVWFGMGEDLLRLVRRLGQGGLF
ncbi:MAG: hypothetical protein LBB60_12055 [Desulfovibrio sp.]|jgi:inner membrane protein|nr:hypothetical protein [Desulfovibrio sp.]